MALEVAIILLVVLLFGQLLLDFFGVTIDAFRVGGGILIVLMAIAMLHARTSKFQQTDAEAHESIEKEPVLDSTAGVAVDSSAHECQLPLVSKGFSPCWRERWGLPPSLDQGATDMTRSLETKANRLTS